MNATSTVSSTFASPLRPSARDRFFAAADALLAEAHSDLKRGAVDLALEHAYQAALRVAGGWNAASPVIRSRKRLPRSAWERLKLTGETGAHWASRLSSYSNLRGRVASGLEVDPDRLIVERLIRDVEEFFAAAQPGAPLVA
ncbi:hypothetical protein CAPI_03985 [Corynebacterium capitovis DSM 44611]|uniref:SAV_6107 family HEPN domain-containing protein n=1 Tax=Corynebacterium capitovis TaxID=131081 RepID=UPI00037F86BE|nr:SAV_6107 family HEPN domain-containing protein [Corynebacterium capitovis]WKD57355.1 hypothetical protein CAPI_03985 [Corynebacterium capitovis DSM 44611]